MPAEALFLTPLRDFSAVEHLFLFVSVRQRLGTGLRVRGTNHSVQEQADEARGYAEHTRIEISRSPGLFQLLFQLASQPTDFLKDLHAGFCRECQQNLSVLRRSEQSKAAVIVDDNDRIRRHELVTMPRMGMSIQSETLDPQ